MKNTETAAQLDLDKLEALAVAFERENCPRWYNDFELSDGITFEPSVEFIKYASPATILALIAQARAQPAAAPIALSVNSGEGAPNPGDIVRQSREYQRKVDEKIIAQRDATIADLRAQLARAERALKGAGFEDHGAEEWKPPIGPEPRFVPVGFECQLAQQRQAVPHAPAGWKLVPVEPTQEMLDAIEDAAKAECSVEWDSNLGSNLHFGDAENVYRDMIAAAPAAPHAQAEPVALREMLALCDHLIHTDGRNARSIACDIRPKIEAAILAAPAPQEAEQASASPAGVELPTNDEVYGAVVRMRGKSGMYISTNAVNDVMAAVRNLVSPTATKG